MAVPTELFGPYRLVEEIARGGMGVVYRARDEQAGRDVALKLLLRRQGEDGRALGRFHREALALAKLRHPNLVTVHDAGEVRGMPYVVMELLRGPTLEERLETQGPLPVSEAAEIVMALAQGLTHAHAQGILHRDLKPSNVICTERGPVLTDFGLARAVDPSADSLRLSASGALLGTPSYWAPEQARSERDRIGPPTDVFGLGGILYALLTGRPPQVGENLIALLAAMEQPPTAPSELRPEAAGPLEAICLRCLERNPADRFTSTAELGDALGAYRQGEAAPSRWRLRLVVPFLALLFGLAAVAVVQRTTRTLEDGPSHVFTPPSVRLEREAIAVWEAALREEGLGDFDAARTGYARVLELEPRFVEALWRRARLEYHRRTDVQGAAVDCERALLLDPACVEAKVHLAWARFWLDRQDKPRIRRYELEVEAIQARAPEVLDAYIVRAFMHRFQGEMAPAVVLLEQVLAFEPDHGQASHDLAWVYRNKRDFAKSLEYCRQVKRVQPKRLDIYRLSGDMKRMSGDLEGALADLLKVAEAEPDSTSSWGNLVLLYQTLGRHREALRVLAKLERLRPLRASQLRDRGLSLMQLRQWPEAEAAFVRAIELHQLAVARGAESNEQFTREDHDSYLFLGSVIAEQGRIKEALSAFERAQEFLEPGTQEYTNAVRLEQLAREQLARRRAVGLGD